MRAAILDSFDGVGALRLGTISTPVPAPDELLVRVRAVSVNAALDERVCVGRWPVAPPLPHVPGIDPAGEVVAVGNEVSAAWAIGDRVAFGSIRCGNCLDCRSGEDWRCAAARMPGVARHGGMAEFVALPARAAFRVPPTVAFTDASYAVRHGGLALYMLGPLKAGDSVLVTGATGALGSAAVQIARAHGAHVTAYVGSVEKADAARALGAEMIADARTTGIAIAIETTGEPRVWQAALATLETGGRLIGSAGGAAPVALDLRQLYTRRLTIAGAALGRSSHCSTALALAAAGRLRAPVAAVFALDRVAEAYALAADRATVGKIFIDPSKGAS